MRKGCYQPVWNEQIVVTEMFPPLCRRLRVQLRDNDSVNDDVIGACALPVCPRVFEGRVRSSDPSIHIGKMPLIYSEIGAANKKTEFSENDRSFHDVERHLSRDDQHQNFASIHNPHTLQRTVLMA